MVNSMLNRGKQCPLPTYTTGEETLMADRFAHFFSKKIENINSYISNLRNTSVEPVGDVDSDQVKCKLSSFKLVTKDEVLKVIMKSPTKNMQPRPYPNTSTEGVCSP